MTKWIILIMFDLVRVWSHGDEYLQCDASSDDKNRKLHVSFEESDDPDCEDAVFWEETEEGLKKYCMLKPGVAGGDITYTINSCSAPDGGGDDDDEDDILTFLSEDEKFTTLISALEKAEITGETISNLDQVTIFAPTDEAFNNLDQTLLATLLEPMNKQNLTNILYNHIVEDKVEISEGKLHSKLYEDYLFYTSQETKVYKLLEVGELK